MRRSYFIVAMALVLVSLQSPTAKAISLTDIDFWVGTGSNQAALVFDWNDGKDPLIWGYQWDGMATAFDMVHAIISADSRLYAKVSTQFGPALGEFIYGLGYDRDNDGFSLLDGTVFTDGFFQGLTTDGGTAADADDSYVEGSISGFWAYYIANGNPYQGDIWRFSDFGISGTVLVNGGFQGFSFDAAPDFDSGTPDEPVPAQPGTSNITIPEPGTLIMLGCSAMGLMVRRRLR